MLRNVVVHIAVGRSPLRCPIVLVVPVGLGEIQSRPHSLCTESVDNIQRNVRLGIAAVGAFRTRHAVVRLGTAEHTETVVVLGGEHHILHARRFGQRGHLRGIEFRRVKRLVQRLVTLLILHVGHPLAVYPRLVANAPRLHHTPLGIHAPVHHKAELQVLPLGNTVQDYGVGLRLLGLLCHTHTRRGHQGHQQKQSLHNKIPIN